MSWRKNVFKMGLPSQVQVLVVGAGPTGLVAAITLAQLGVQVAIVDSSPINRNGSRAAVVHAHTLEVLEPIGLAQPIVESGIRCDNVLFRGTTNDILKFKISQLRDVTKYPFALLIPQHEIEKILKEHLLSTRVYLSRNQTVVGMRQNDRGGVQVSFEDGNIVNAQYVIGADGSRSTIRRLVGIEFVDPHTGVLYDDPSALAAFYIVLADVQLEEPLPASVYRDQVAVYLDNFFLMIPLRDSKGPEENMMFFWRVGFVLPADAPKPPKAPTLEYLQHMMDTRNPWDTKITISSVSTSTRYRVRSAVASSYFQKLGDGNILLAGDAAHVHSPVGGQGMNLGMCDAVAAAHAIQSHLQAKDPDQSSDALRHYAESRRKIGVRVVGFTRGLTTIINTSTGWKRVVRNIVLRVVSYLPFVNRRLAWRISGLANRDP